MGRTIKTPFFYGDFNYKKLSHKEQKELLRKYQETKDKKYRDEFIKSIMPMIYNLAYKFHTKFQSHFYTVDDLFGEALIVVYNALDKYNFSTAPTTYFYHVAKNHIIGLLQREQKYNSKIILSDWSEENPDETNDET